MARPNPFPGVLRSDLEIAIFEANLGEKLTFIAQRRFIDGWGLMEICGDFEDEYGFPIDRATVSRWIKNGEAAVRRALAKVQQNCK